MGDLLSATISTSGVVRQLDKPKSAFDAADENVREEDVRDPKRLTTLLVRILRDLKEIRRRFLPRHIDFEDVAVDGTSATKTLLAHHFKGRVRFWVVEWKPTVLGDVFQLEKHADTTDNVLVLLSGRAGVATIRVQETG